MANIENEEDLTFFQHLVELRDKLLNSFVVLIIVFVILFPFANDIYTFVAQPLLNSIPGETKLISIGVISPFLTPLKLALTFALYISMPFIIYQIWSFIAPALYKKEKRFIVPLVVSTGLLFYSGVLFAFYIVFPVIFSFLAGVGPSVVNFTPDIQFYLDFALKVSFAFGIAFQVPIATIILVKFGIASVEGLRKNRPFIVIGAFVVGMLLTPPDIISQTMIAIPMWILFEIGLLVASRISKNVDDSSDDTEKSGVKSDDTGSPEKSESANKLDDENDIDDDDDDDFGDSDFDGNSFDEIPDWDGELDKK